MKGMSRAIGLDHLLTMKEHDGDEEILEKTWRQEQETVVNVVMWYLKVHIVKKLDRYDVLLLRRCLR